MSIIKDTNTVLDTHSSVGGIGTPRWSAPELLDPTMFGFKSCTPSKKSDCYSFGMTIYEVCCAHCITQRFGLSDAAQVLTGKVPFHDVRTDAVMMPIVRGSRPERPRLSHAIGFSDPVWATVEECWKADCSFRPDVQTVVGCLAAAATQWTPTPPLDDFGTSDESEAFSLISLYRSSETTNTSSKLFRYHATKIETHNDDPDSTTPRRDDLDLSEDNGEARTVAPPHHENSAAENLHVVAERFHGYYLRTHKLEDLDWAIKHEKEAVLMHLPTHPGRLRCLTRLAGYYYERHEASQDPQDIRLSIEKSSDVERRTATGDPIRPDALLILAKAHHACYYRGSQQENLEAAIKFSSEAVTLYPNDHPIQGETLMILSVALFDRYQKALGWGGQPLHYDLDSAISNSIAAIDLFPIGDPTIPYSRTKLSTFLFARYEQHRNLTDLRQSIYHARLALADLAPEKRSESLIYLGHLLTHLSPDSQTLTELAKCSREALELLPFDDYRRTGAIYNLVIASHRMYVTLGSTAHLDEAVDNNRQLLRLLPHGSRLGFSQLQLHCTLLEYRWNERQLNADFAEMADTRREIAAAEAQSHYNHYYPSRPIVPPPSASDPPPSGSPTAASFQYRAPQNWSPRPYYYDDSAISVTGGNYSATSSVETGDYGGGSESSLVEHALNLSFAEPDLGRHCTPHH